MSVRAFSPEVRLLKLDKETFERILGSIKNLLKMDYINWKADNLEQGEQGGVEDDQVEEVKRPEE